MPTLAITLTPMTDADYDVYLPYSVGEYAKDHVAAGDWTPEEALERSAREFAQLLPDGVRTAGNWLYMLVNEAGEKVGYIWYAAHPRRGEIAFIYDFEVYESFRRRGYGAAALEALAAEAQGRGFKSLQLHVFGHNAPARRLYAKLGFAETHVTMEKTL